MPRPKKHIEYKPNEHEAYLSVLLTMIYMLEPEDRQFIKDNILLPNEEWPEAWKRMILRPNKFGEY